MADFISIYTNTPNPKDLMQAVRVLENGGVIIFPTDTVYGLGCLSNNLKALDRFAAIKGVKLEQAPLSFLFEDIRSLSDYVAPMNSQTFKLVKRLLPGPYALIMHAAHKLHKPFLITSSLHDPDEILDYTTDPENLFQQWEPQIDLMLSDGYGNNIPSTVLNLTTEPFEVIREGVGEIPF